MDADIAHAISLIQAAYDPSASDPAAIESLQNSLLQMQRTRPAWGLIVPLLAHQDPNVQFFGAHTAHVKISRGELESLTVEERDGLKETLLALVGVAGRKAFVQKKLYAALTALAIRLVPRPGPGLPSGWEGWVEATVRAMVAGGLGNAEIHKFLAGAAEDVASANLLPQTKIDVQESLRVASPLVLQSIVAVISSSPHENHTLRAALECLLAWYPTRLIPAQDLIPLVPPLISLLDVPDSPSSDALCEILSRPPDSWGPSVLIEPMLLWLARIASPWHQQNANGNTPWYPNRSCHLIDVLGEAAVDWTEAAGPSTLQPTRASLAQLLLRLMLALTALDEGGAALPEWMDLADDGDLDDQFSSESSNAGSSLGFWFLLQESLWDIPPANPYLFSASSSRTSTPPPDPDDPDTIRGRGGVGGTPFTPGISRIGSYSFGALSSAVDDDVTGTDTDPATTARNAHAQAVYVALVHILRRKSVWRRAWLTNEGSGRSEKELKDREARFSYFRRETGDALLNAFYILRTDLLDFYVSDAAGRLERGEPWEEIEATLHCLDLVNEAVDIDALAREMELGSSTAGAFSRLFGGDLWGRLPTSAVAPANLLPREQAQEKAAINRLRKTALQVVDTYTTYFTHRPPTELAGPLHYVIDALWDEDRQVGVEAAIALRGLCDANRQALAERISSFAQVHARLDGVPDQSKQKVLQSIASVIQALPPAEAIAPLESMVAPIVHKLKTAINAAEMHPEAARAVAIQHFDIIAAIAKGLTRITDALAGDYDGSVDGQAEIVMLRAAREDPRMRASRDAIFECIVRMAELWSDDLEVGVRPFKAITALPDDITLISLPPAPLLGVVCQAAGRRLTAVWLSLAAILIGQLNPPPLLLTDKSGPTQEAEQYVRDALRILVSAGLGLFAAPGGMMEPDIIQEFFACMDRTAQDFTTAFCALPDGAFDALLQCATTALSMQERYSLVAACTFLGTLIHRTALFAILSPDLLKQLQAHMIRRHGRSIMRAVLAGFAGAAPRSAVNNLLELLGAIVSRWDDQAVGEALGGEGQKAQGGARAWAAEVVFADDFYPSRAGPEAKERLVKTLMSSRSVKKTKEAANQFMMIAWGLEGSTFGYSSATV
ncbi:armadillo-type protein [Mycena amicta]|nr:armadillo-type protein [Mycena amicta]